MKSAFVSALTAQINLSSAAQIAHWNVEGKNFYSYHLLFGEVYEIVHKKLDGLAEKARGQGVEIPAEIFCSVPEVDWETPEELAKELLVLVDEFCTELDGLHKEVDEAGKYGVLALVEDIMSDLDKVKYLLSSTTV